jgi:hypothetical protein
MDYKFLLECKNDLFNFLSSMLVIPIYTGIRGMYEYSVKMHNTLEERCKSNSKLVNPGIASILKLCLNDITSLNNYEIENIYNDIKQQSGCYNYFDDLVKACFKSYILLLTYNPVYESSKFSSPEFYENIVVKDFIHKCYIEVSNYFKENIELIAKDRKREIYNTIKECIENSIKKSISNYDEIIKEYLKIKFDTSTKKEDKMSYDNIKSMVSKMINTQKYGGIGNIGQERQLEIVGGGESSFNNVENFINANKELDAIVNNNYNDEKVGGDSTGKNYILNTQSNDNSTTNMINVGMNKDKDIDNILNNNLEPINEEEVGKETKNNAYSITSTDVNCESNVNESKLNVNESRLNVNESRLNVNEGTSSVNESTLNMNESKTSVNESTLNMNESKTSVNESTLNMNESKTSLLESPMPIRNNKINDIITPVKKGRPPKNKNADKFFNNLA